MPRASFLTATALATLLAAVALPSAGSADGVDLPTSCAQEADAAVDEGLTLLHNMMYIQAEAAFNRAAEAEPECAMAQWGIAMANFHPLWPGTPTEAEATRGQAAAQVLASLTPGNALEQAFADAATAFYAPDHGTYRARIAAWAAAQEVAYSQTPDNVDAAALAALARLATAPPGPESIATKAAVGDLLDQLHAREPRHPGVIHYAIHAFDNPRLKDRGLPYADIYDEIAPSAAHALHMPAHIFTRTGDWARSIDLNRRSAKAARAQSGEMIQTHYVHAIDYMVYGHLQLGQPQEAERLVEEMLAIDTHQVSFGGAYALAASPLRLFLEQDKWAEAAALSPDMHTAIPWDAFPQTVAMRWFAKGLGAARIGNLETAGDAVERLQALKDAMQARGQGYWARLAESQILTVSAWIALAQGDSAGAIAQQTEAAEIEDAAGKSPVTPGHVLPARELLGDMYGALGQADKAAEAYRATLANSPNRARSIAALE